MSTEKPTNPIDALQERLGTEWHSINQGRAEAELKRTELRNALTAFDSEDSSIVVFGSLARDEFTSGSDIDWTLLVDGSADPVHFENSLEISKIIKGLGKEPGQEGTFGDISFSHDLIHRIGGSDDTNRNTTQRILLLLESAALGRSEAYERVRRNVLRRYVHQDYGLLHATRRFNVPRFLQNDIARYWRTVAVDFAYKQRKRADAGWALRSAKLRMSRKLTYASGLLICFSCEFDPPEALQETDNHEDSRMHVLVEHFGKYAKQTPLEVIAGTTLRYPDLDHVTRTLFGSYNEFLGLLANEGNRTHLEHLTREAASNDSLYQLVQTIGKRFQDSLTRVFLESNGTPIYKLTKEYGVF